MNVMSVQKPFARSQTSGHIRELTQVRKHTTASNVERLFVGSHTSANIRIFTEEKHYECRKHKSSLDKHHTEETPYDCNECGKTCQKTMQGSNPEWQRLAMCSSNSALCWTYSVHSHPPLTVDRTI